MAALEEAEYLEGADEKSAREDGGDIPSPEPTAAPDVPNESLKPESSRKIPESLGRRSPARNSTPVRPSEAINPQAAAPHPSVAAYQVVLGRTIISPVARTVLKPLACVLYSSPKPAKAAPTFTKVLSREEDTLSIEALAMNHEQRMVRKGFFTLLLGLGGLWLLDPVPRQGTQHRRHHPRNGRGLQRAHSLQLRSASPASIVDRHALGTHFGNHQLDCLVLLPPVARYPPPLQTLPKNLLIMKLALTPETGPARRPPPCYSGSSSALKLMPNRPPVPH